MEPSAELPRPKTSKRRAVCLVLGLCAAAYLASGAGARLPLPVLGSFVAAQLPERWTLGLAGSRVAPPPSRAGTPQIDARLAMVYPLRSLEEFEAEREEAKKLGCLMVIKYFKPGCRSCAALGPKFDALARQFGEKHRFYAVNYAPPAGKHLCEEHKLEMLPTVAVYGPSGEKLVQEAVSARKWSGFLERFEKLESELMVEAPR